MDCLVYRRRLFHFIFFLGIKRFVVISYSSFEVKPSKIHGAADLQEHLLAPLPALFIGDDSIIDHEANYLGDTLNYDLGWNDCFSSICRKVWVCCWMLLS
jgi:hypothetical protein